MIHLANCFDILPTLANNSIDSFVLDPPYITTKHSWDQKEVVNDYLAKELFRLAKDTSSLYVWCGIGEKSNSLFRWLPIFSKYWHFKDLITWKKQRGMGNKKGWLYVREECMWFVKDNKKFFWNEENQYDKKSKRLFTMPNNKSEYRRYTNIWDDIKEEAGSMKSAEYHETQKPVDCMKRPILLSTKEGDIVLDCFAGSGTTGVACEETNRKYILIELDEKKYNDCLIRTEEARIGYKKIDNKKITSLF